MITYPTIAALKAKIESEVIKESINHAKIVKQLHELNNSSTLPQIAVNKNDYNMAVTLLDFFNDVERLLPLIEKAVEVIDFYGNAGHLNEKDSDIIELEYGSSTKLDYLPGKKAREFLAEIEKEMK